MILGVDATNRGQTEILIAALAGRTAGAMSMAAGEYVRVRSHAPSPSAAGEKRKRGAID